MFSFTSPSARVEKTGSRPEYDGAVPPSIPSRNPSDGILLGLFCNRDRNRCSVFRRDSLTHGTRFSSSLWRSVDRLDTRHSFLPPATSFGPPWFIASCQMFRLHASLLLRLGLRWACPNDRRTARSCSVGR